MVCLRNKHHVQQLLCKIACHFGEIFSQLFLTVDKLPLGTLYACQVMKGLILAFLEAFQHLTDII